LSFAKNKWVSSYLNLYPLYFVLINLENNLKLGGLFENCKNLIGKFLLKSSPFIFFYKTKVKIIHNKKEFWGIEEKRKRKFLLQSPLFILQFQCKVSVVSH